MQDLIALASDSDRRGWNKFAKKLITDPSQQSAPKRSKGRRRSSQEDVGDTEGKTYTVCDQ